MEQATARLTVFFEDPFWVGVYEREDGGVYEAAKIVFGAEPKDYAVYAFFLQHWSKLQFSPPTHGAVSFEKRTNPKRLQREIRAQLQQTGASTKAQQALKQAQEAGRQARHRRAKDAREAQQERRYALHETKKKEKHRGH